MALRKKPEQKSTRETEGRKSAPRGIKPCGNAGCKLRQAGCHGFEACPGYKARKEG